MTAEQRKILDGCLKQIQKKHGAESIAVMSDMKVKDVKSISTGSILIDKAIGVNGLPYGRICEIFGPESSGKTTVALQILAQAQQKGEVVAFIDAEQALDMKYAKALGINPDDLVFSQPDSGEQGLEMVETLCNSGVVKVIIVDSVAALIPKSELEGEMDDIQVGAQARMLSKAIRKITQPASKNGVLVLFINQIRDKIGVMGYGEKTQTTGGHALRFASSVRLKVAKIQTIKQGDKEIGNKVKVQVVKNKVSAPYGVAETEIMFGKGILAQREIVDIAVKTKVIDKSGAWFSYGDTKLGQGKETVVNKLLEDNELFKEIRDKSLLIFNPETDDSLALDEDLEANDLKYRTEDDE